MARNFWRRSVSVSHRPRLMLEGLESREVPAIIQNGLPSWLAAGPTAVTNNQPNGLTGTYINPAAGAITDIAPDPTNPSVAYVAAGGGGIWRTTNATDADPVYTPLTDNLPSLSTTAIDINPANRNQVVAGLGRLTSVLATNGDEVGPLVGLLYTENASDPTPTFRVLGANTPLAGLSITQVIVRNGYILATGSDSDGSTTNDGTYLSRDNGFTFTKLDGTGGLPAQPNGGVKTFDIVADPGDPNRVYLAGQNGLFRTDNILAQTPTWATLTSPLFALTTATANAKIAIHNSAAANVVYLSTAAAAVRGNQLNGVFWSTDRGQTWTDMDLPVQVNYAVPVEDATLATPIVIKSTFHGLQTGDRVQVSGVTGNLAANGVWTVTRVDDNNFSLDGSVGTGKYTGGGSYQFIYGVNYNGFGETYQSLAADPTDPNLVYVGGTYDYVGFSGNILRGDRSAPRTYNAIEPPNQWSPIVGNGALGTSPASFSHALVFDAAGTLYEADDAGLYRRAAPQADLSAWESANGNLSALHAYSVAYDSNSNVLMEGAFGTGTAQQTDGTGAAGSTVWDSIDDFSDYSIVATDTTSAPGVTARYVADGAFVQRSVYNAKNVQVGNTTFANLASPTDPGTYKGIDANTAGTPNQYVRFALDGPDPRQAVLSIHGQLYEDNDPAGLPLDVVAKVTPTGLTGDITTLNYGGRQNGLDITRIMYVGTSTGQLFVRGAAGGFNAVTVPGAGAIRSVAVDPDNWRSAYVLQGDRTVTNPATFQPPRIFHTTDGGATWTEITENLYTAGTDSSGNPVGGLTADVRSLALWDSAPGDSVGGGVVLLAGGAGGVFRYVPSIVDPAVSSGGWTEYGAGLPNAVVNTVAVSGNRLIAGTEGRGVWVVPDISGTITQAAVVTVQGGDGDDSFTFGGSGGSSGTVFLSDGQGNSLFVGRNTGASFSFVGGKGADTLTISTSGQPGGDLQFLSGRLVADLGNDPGDSIVISDQGRAIPTTVTVTANTVGGGASDNIFAPGAVLVYSGLAQGTLRVDLGTQAVGGNLVNVQSTSAATTALFGTNGADAFVLNGKAGTASETGDLSGIFGTVAIDARGAGLTGGGNTLAVSDIGAASGNANVSLVGGQILGLAGPTDAAVVTHAGITSLTVTGSDSATLAESFRIENVTAPLTLFDRSGPDTINVRAANNAVTLNGGPGADVFRITSTAGDNLDGDLNGITAPVTVNAGTGDSQLVVSNYGNNLGSQYTVTSGSISGATPVPIAYSTAGRFVGADGDGVWLRGSNAAGDTFNVPSTLGNGSQTAIDGDGGDDVFNVGADNLGANGTVALRAGAGSNFISVDSGVFGVTATSLTLVGGGGGTTRASVLGFAAADKVTPAVTVTDTVNGSLTGIGNPINFNSLTNLDYDGRGGRNSFLYRDASNVGFGSLASPGAGIVYQPKGVASGEIRLAGVGPVVNVVNINGSDAGGLLIDGGSGATRDTVTVVGVSDTNLAVTGPLAGTTADNGSDAFDVSDQAVTVYNQSLGQLRSVAVVPGTVRTLIVQGGNESLQGDTFNVAPSAGLDILVDGGGPTRKKNGNTLTVNTAEAYHLERAADPFFGTLQTRITADSGASFAFQNFPNAAGVRSIFAVGADAGGGPRVRVYDSITKEVLFDQFVYDPAFTGGVRVATGDVTGDGVPDLIVAAGVGGGPHIQVFDGITFQPVASFFAYENTFRGGSFVSVGDLNGDGVGDIIVGAGLGGGPLVKVFDGTGRALTAFFAYDKAFRGGVRVASGDVNGDGKDDIVTGAGPGGGPNVKVFNASDLAVLASYLAFDPSYTGGVYVAAGDVNGDGTADVVVGPGDNSVPQISVRDSRTGVATLLSVFDIGVISDPDPLPAADPATLTAESSQETELGGIRVATADLNAAGTRQIVVSRGPGYVPRVRTYTVNPLAEAGNFLAFETAFTGGVYVGSTFVASRERK